MSHLTHLANALEISCYFLKALAFVVLAYKQFGVWISFTIEYAIVFGDCSRVGD